MSAVYTFAGAERERERRRLQYIEEIFDPATQRRLALAGLGRGSRCLELGAGAGSIARHMAERVGPNGSVVALDLDTGFLPERLPATMSVMRGDVRHVDLPSSRFDVVHARYVLIHNADYSRIIDRLVDALAPGGSIVLEEPDFTAARAAESVDSAGFRRVNQAIVAMFVAAGRDPAIGLRLPVELAARGLVIESVENEAPICRGGDAIAKMMSMSTEQLRDRYLATGLVGEEDLATYVRFANTSSSWGIYYSTIGVVVRKPPE